MRFPDTIYLSCIGILACLLVAATGNKLQAQDTKPVVDSSLAAPVINPDFITVSYPLQPMWSIESLLQQEPAKGDIRFIRQWGWLAKKGPDYRNYDKYASLADAYWRCGYDLLAKKMFRTIIRSREPYYTGTMFHSAGNKYEYGSYTSNYKNDASIGLCKIYLKEKKFAEALQAIRDADSVYTIRYSCGTASLLYRQEMESYYFACYNGLHDSQALISWYFNHSFLGDSPLISIIREQYNDTAIATALKIAVDSFRVDPDDWATETYVQCGESEEDSLIKRYYNGTASTVLFGRKVTLPRMELDNWEHISLARYLAFFRASDFYQLLSGEKKASEL